MNESQVEALRSWLVDETKRYKKRFLCITDNDIRLDEDNGQILTTEAEILVFGIDRELVPALQVAYSAYESLLDISQPFNQEISDLIKAARNLAPDDLQPLQLKQCRCELFQWFGKRFLDLPYRQTHGMYEKRNFNLHAVCKYKDE